MSVAQTFDNRLSSLAERRAALDRAAGTLATQNPAAPTAGPRPAATGPSDAIQLPPALAELLPSGLERGEAVELDTPGSEPDYLTLALLAGALRAGLWCATIGLPQLGYAALADMVRADGGPTEPLHTLLAVHHPGPHWAEATAILAEGLDLIVLRPVGLAPPTSVRQVSARLRQRSANGERHAAALAVLGRWSTARATLRTDRSAWLGLQGTGPSAGTGHVNDARVRISAEGRATRGRRRSVEVRLSEGFWVSVRESSNIRTLSRRGAA